MGTLRLEVQGREILVDLKSCQTAREIERACPIDSTVARWGDEIYFEIPVRCASGPTTIDVQAGDAAYWPEGHCFCLFFGKTPASTGNAPRPASPVEVIGRTKAEVPLLRSIQAGRRVRVIQAREIEDEA